LRAADVDAKLSARLPKHHLKLSLSPACNQRIHHHYNTQPNMAFQMAPATPQRPTPGAFVNTPAPNRPGFARQGSMAQPQPQQQQTLPAPPAESPIDRASRTLNSMMEKDNRFPALESYVSRE
jgi:hypothetical protein